MIFTDQEALDKIKELSEGIPTWVTQARDNSKVYRALVNGDDFCEILINEIEKLESKNKADVRKKYSKDIRDLFERVMKPRENVFQSNGGSEKLLITNENIKKIFIKAQSNFKSNKSVFKYLSEVYFKLADTDPNGLIFLEYKSTGKTPYPTYKSISDIRDYEPNGQKVEYVAFEPKDKVVGTDKVKIWRLVDDLNDRQILEQKGEFYIIPDSSFIHPFGEVPGIILSEREVVGTNLRIPSIDKIVELAKDYARDKSILTIYKFQKGFPTHWRYVTQCRQCTGLGKKGDKTCDTCNGHGYIKNQDVTDIVTIPIPESDQPVIAPDIAGFVSPDLQTWTQYKDDLKDLEKVMKDTMWGTHLYTNQNQNVQETETASGRYIDVQPIINTLNPIADTVEYVDNTICNWILNFIDPIKDKFEMLYNKTYGRRYIIENPDVILLRYQEAKKTSDSSTILDKLLEEFILSKYKNDQVMQNIMLKKKAIEPYVHMTFEQINTAFGAEEAHKKELFNKFWSQSNIYSDEATLLSEFNAYYETNKKTFVKEQANNTK